MSRKKRKNICYYCGNIATSKEHLPPKQMFNGFECDSITVPSCAIHNCSKGGADQAIISAFLIYFKNSLENNRKLNPSLEKAINNSLSSFERTKYKVESRHLLKNLQDYSESIPKVGFIKESISIKDWIKHLTAGLVFDTLKSFNNFFVWDTIESWSPQYIPSKNTTSESDKLNALILNKDLENWFENQYSWQNGWSAYPRNYPKEIYHFYISINDSEVMFKHRFYNTYNFYSWFKNFENMNEIIQLKLST